MVGKKQSSEVSLGIASGSISGGQRGPQAASGQPGQSLEPTAFFCIIHYSLNSAALGQEGSQLRVLVTGTGLAQPGDLDCN